MHPEFLGFLFGAVVIGGVGLAFVKHEWWKSVSAAYDRESGKGTRPRNALIWPSH